MDTFRKMRAEKGFTLIELLVVIAIIGILAAIAIPQFAAYRRRAFVSAAQTDLRNAATAQEAYFVDFNTYFAGAITTNLVGYNRTAEITLTSTGGAATFILMATHDNCASVNWTYDSSSGSTAGAAGGCP